MDDLDRRLSALRAGIIGRITQPDVGEIAARARRRRTQRGAQYAVVGLVAVLAVVVPLLWLVGGGRVSVGPASPVVGRSTITVPTTVTVTTGETTVELSSGKAEAAPSTLSVPSAVLPGQRGWQLVVRTSDGVLAVDPATGRATHTPFTLQSTGPVSFLAGIGWVMVRPLDFVAGYLIRDGKAATQLPSPLLSGPVIAGPGPETVWASAEDGFSLVNLDGSSAGSHLPAWDNSDQIVLSPTTDGAGGILIGAASGFYDLNVDGRRTITRSGAVVAVGPTVFLVQQCADGKCALRLLPRSGGPTIELPGSLTDGETTGVAGLVSSDGTHAALLLTKANFTRWHLIDLQTGADVPIDVETSGRPGEATVAFSPDGKYLFVVSATGQLHAVTVASGVRNTMQMPESPVEQVVVALSPAG